MSVYGTAPLAEATALGQHAPFIIRKFAEPTWDSTGGWVTAWEGTPDDDTAPMFAVDLMREILDSQERGYKVGRFFKLNAYYEMEYVNA